MGKTSKNRQTNNNSTKKNRECQIPIKPFEKKFGEHLGKNLVKSNKNIQKQIVKEMTAKFAPNAIKPNDDYYDYINYQWLKDISVKEKQKYIVQIDDFRLAQDKVYNELNGIILDYIKTHNDSLAKNMKNFYNSVISMNSKEDTRKRAKETVEMIDQVIKEGNPWKMLALVNSDEMLASNAPFIWSVNPDEKNPHVFASCVDSHQFSILDLNVYFDDGTDVQYKTKYINAFHNANKELFRTLLGKNNLNYKDIFEVERDIFDALGCVKVTSKEEDVYNKVFADESLSKYNFDWHEFAKQLGYKTIPKFFITSSLNYLKCGSELLLKNWNTPKWRTYWIWIYLKRLARITRGWEKINYDFNGKFERGQEKINKSDAVSAALYMSLPFNKFLTNEYCDKYLNPNAAQYVSVLCEDLRQVFIRIIKRNSWLAPSTKNYALEKLKHFHFTIGKPAVMVQDPKIDYTTNLYDNLVKLMEWRKNEFIDLTGKQVVDLPMMDWTQYPVKMVGSQAYIVNASYTPTKNGIYINAGYIQKPFVDLDERGIEYNLAHVGFTIGHEMSHSLDDLGSQYDYKGNLFNWWTPQDTKKFKAIQADVIKQYAEFAARDGIKFDASIGVGEDLADISGLAICNEYLRDFQEKNNDIVPIRYLSFEAFYVYYALQERQKVGKKGLSAQLKTNPHPLDKYRTNVPLSRSDMFRAIYNVKKGDGMWWHNTNTVW